MDREPQHHKSTTQIKNCFWITPGWLFEDARLGPMDIHIFSYLKTLSDNNCAIKASNSHLSKLFRKDVSRIQAILEKLEKLGYIERRWQGSQRFIRILTQASQLRCDGDLENKVGGPCKQGAEDLENKVHISKEEIKEKTKDKYIVPSPSERTENQSNPLFVLFLTFYNCYPRKEQRKAAFKAFLKVFMEWRKQSPSCCHEEFIKMLIADVEARMAGNWYGRDKKMIPLPATYLNGKQWEGEIYKATPTKNPKHVDLAELHGLNRHQEQETESFLPAALPQGSTFDAEDN